MKNKEEAKKKCGAENLHIPTNFACLRATE